MTLIVFCLLSSSSGASPMSTASRHANALVGMNAEANEYVPTKKTL